MDSVNKKQIQEPARDINVYAEAEVVVVDNRFAVRITRITGVDAAGQAEA